MGCPSSCGRGHRIRDLSRRLFPWAERPRATTSGPLLSRSPVPFRVRRGALLTEFRARERAFGAFTVFRVVASVQAPALAGHLPRRERWVLLLLDGRRSVAHLARLTQRTELDVASTLARLLQWGYIEPVNVVEYSTNHFESG